MVEVVRLGIVLTALAAAASLSSQADTDSRRLLQTVVLTLVGYLVGGLVGRALLRGIERLQERLTTLDSRVVFAVPAGAIMGALAAGLVTWPVLLLPGRPITVPLASVALAVSAYAGARLAGQRAGDLVLPGRRVGPKVRGKILDTSALMDGRLPALVETGFLEGPLVVPMAVLHELQSQADASEERRRNAGVRGLNTLDALRESTLADVVITDADATGVDEVDAKLLALCRAHDAALVTADGNLRRVAQLAGVRVLDVRALANAVRPTYTAGDEAEVRIVRRGQQKGQGVAYTEDGTIVIVERAGEAVGETLPIVVTSVVQGRQGRMLFAVPAEERW